MHIPNMSSLTAVFVFIFVAAITGIFIEGFCQICLDKYYNDKGRRERLTDKNRGKDTLLGHCFDIIIARPTIFRVCEDFFKNNEEVPIQNFSYDSKKKH
jgi:ornithine carbamoyltransferase